MKVLRFLLILILILAVGYIVLSAVSPKEMNVEKSTTINAPASVVWDQMVHFKNWDNWSPWKEMDTTITTTVSANDGEVGSTSHYTAKKAGEGTMINTGVNGMEMTYSLEFIKPFHAMTSGAVKVTDSNGVVTASQRFHEDIPFMMRGMSALMGGQKMIEKSFTRGMELLKAYSEAHAAEAAANTGIQVKDVQFPGGNYAAIRKVISWNDMHTFYSESYAALGKAAGQRIAGPASSIVYKWDEEKNQADLAAAFPVSGTEAVKGATMINVPASSA